MPPKSKKVAKLSARAEQSKNTPQNILSEIEDIVETKESQPQVQKQTQGISQIFNQVDHILVEDSETNLVPKTTLETLVGGSVVRISNAYFVDPNKIVVSLNGIEHAYTLTKK